jgi:adenylyltransferase/sulfurtransferase
MDRTSRYAVQERFASWGGEGQDLLRAATVVIVGVGALGGVSSGLLARAGVGRLRLVDPDRVALDNLHRQILYTEADAAHGRKKVEAAARFLSAANSETALEPVTERMTPANALELLAGADLVVDGLDNAETRYLLNEACHHLGAPWVHAGGVGSRGQVMVVRPGRGPCLRCWAPPPRGQGPRQSVASHGIIGPLPSILAGLQANEAIKLLLRQEEDLLSGVMMVELWPPRFRVMELDAAISERCPACRGEFEFLG